jgi:hypothetical protein
MNRKLWSVFAGLCGVLVFTLWAVPSRGQNAPVKEKPPMYSYVAEWQIPRAHWSEMAQSNDADKAILDKALADGTIVGYGNDEVLVHQIDGETHDNWWSSMSMAGLIHVLDQFYASPNTTSGVLSSATKHWDLVMISRYYNWHSGPYKTGYTIVAGYQLKPDAPNDALDLLSQNLVAPLLEKMLSDGTILEYEIDTQTIHTQAPGAFWIVYCAPTPEGLDKVNAAVRESLKGQPLAGPAFGSMTDFTAHRDDLLRGEGTYK